MKIIDLIRQIINLGSKYKELQKEVEDFKTALGLLLEALYEARDIIEKGSDPEKTEIITIINETIESFRDFDEVSKVTEDLIDFLSLNEKDIEDFQEFLRDLESKIFEIVKNIREDINNKEINLQNTREYIKRLKKDIINAFGLLDVVEKEKEKAKKVYLKIFSKTEKKEIEIEKGRKEPYYYSFYNPRNVKELLIGIILKNKKEKIRGDIEITHVDVEHLDSIVPTIKHLNIKFKKEIPGEKITFNVHTFPITQKNEVEEILKKAA